jgi:predicted permease
LLDPHVDAGVLAFTAALACAAALVAGIAPALHGSREQFGEALSDGGRGASGGIHATRLRSTLVVAEMALAVISLVGAGLFYESFRNTRSVSPGFDADHVAMAAVSLALAGYDSAHADAVLRRVNDRVQREPGMVAVSYTDYVPLSMGQGSWEDLVVEGYAPERNENMKLYRGAIGPDYFRVMGIPLVAGRDFRSDDDSAHAPVMIVNEAFERHFLRGRSTLGVKVKGWGKWFTIVGVAKDVRNYRLTESPTPYFYVPIRQVYRPEYGYTFLARTAAPVDQAVRAIVDAVKSADPTVPAFNAMPLAEYIAAPLRLQQTAARLLALLAAVALLLAAIGLYGVLDYSVLQRRREIGIRMAIGAQAGDIARRVTREVFGMVAAGAVAGVALGLATVRYVETLLYRVDATGVAMLLPPMVVILAASSVAAIPAVLRAVRIDPVAMLRAD